MSRPLRSYLNPSSLVMVGIPKSMVDLTLNDYSVKECPELRDVKSFFGDYIKNLDNNFESNRGIFLYGSNGVGKTMLASIILKEAYRHRYTVRRCTFVDYMTQYTRVWSARSAEEKESAEDNLFTYYKATEFLVLEEVGKEIDSKAAAPILEDLLRYREDKGYVTIICTNLNLDLMTERYGASIMSLLKGNTVPIRIESADKRNRTFKKRGVKP